jgi:hypothetical protein
VPAAGHTSVWEVQAALPLDAWIDVHLEHAASEDGEAMWEERAGATLRGGEIVSRRVAVEGGGRMRLWIGPPPGEHSAVQIRVSHATGGG